MDHEQKLAILIESLGDGIDEDFARQVLAAHDWSLEAALNSILGDEAGARDGHRDVHHQHDVLRAPMRTGYTENLMGPVNPEDERRLLAEREAERKAVEAERAAMAVLAEKQRIEAVARQVAAQRADAERLALERRRAKTSCPKEQDEAMPIAENGVEAPCIDASTIQQGELLKLQAAERRREEARQSKEVEELQKERYEAEVRQRSRETEALKSHGREVDAVVQALVALKKRHAEADPTGFAICLKTISAYLGNLARNPQDHKFQHINCDNPAFKSRVLAFEGAAAVLEACGFRAEGDAFVADTECLRTRSRLWDALAKVDVMLDQLK